MSALDTAYARAMRIERGADADGDLFTLPGTPDLLGRPGFMHGGAIAGFLAIVADVAASDEFHATTSTMRFLRGGRERATFARATIRSRSARLLVIEASAWQDGEEKPISVLTRIYVRQG